jgi:hypothetical protein
MHVLSLLAAASPALCAAPALAAEEARAPDVVYVPTSRDVVEDMLRLADKTLESGSAVPYLWIVAGRKGAS